MIRRLAIVVLAALVGSPSPAWAYLKLGTRVGSRVVDLKWAASQVRWSITDVPVQGFTASQFQTAVSRAFTTWQDVQSATVTFQFAGFTSARPGADDGVSVLGFENRPELDRVLAATDFTVDMTTGAILESDIFFNSFFSWSVAAAGEAGRWDVESIAVHEIGHFLGLGHSALGETEIRDTGGRRVLGAEAVMFPIALAAGDIQDRVLKADDIAGVSDIYPEPSFLDDTGTVSGRVTKSASGVFGGHLVLFHPASGKLVGGFTLNSNGDFHIRGLAPGMHILRVEPLDDGDLESFFNRDDPVDISFQVKYYDRHVVVGGGSDASRVEVAVTPR